MAIAILFWLLTLICCSFTAGFGGATGRWGAGIFLAAVVASALAMISHDGWADTNEELLAVDLGHFLALYVLAVRSKKYWPIWSAGFQLLAVLTSVATLIDPSVLPKMYRGLEAFWAVPMLITMALGVGLDRKPARKG